MPMFCFHIAEGDRVIEDREGVDLPGARAALLEAKDAARELLSRKVRKGEIIDGQELRVADDLGKQLFTLPFKSVLRLT